MIDTVIQVSSFTTSETGSHLETDCGDLFVCLNSFADVVKRISIAEVVRVSSTWTGQRPMFLFGMMINIAIQESEIQHHDYEKYL